MKSEKFFSFKNENLLSFCLLNQKFPLSLQVNYINLVRNVAGVSASDDDLHAFEGSAGTLPHTKAVTLSVCFKVAQTLNKNRENPIDGIITLIRVFHAFSKSLLVNKFPDSLPTKIVIPYQGL